MAIIEEQIESKEEQAPPTEESFDGIPIPEKRAGPWGKHFIADCALCNQYIEDPEMIKEFAQTLVQKIDMKAYGEPQIVKFGSGDKEGYTLIQLIETSNITAHFCDSTQEAYIDVFSCKDFDPQVVEEVIRDYFNPVRIKKGVINRSA